MAKTLQLAPISIRKARAWINEHHRHHKAPQGAKFAIAATNGQGQIVAVVMVGRPVSRHLDDGTTAEVTRLCTDGTPNACSFLYGAAWRTAKAMGYQRIVTYTLDTEPGTSLKAAGWRQTATTEATSWDRPNRRRTDKHPTTAKIRWEQRT